MKQFISKIIKFFISSIILLVLVTLLVMKIKYFLPISLNSKGIEKIEKINLGLFGDSHLYSGIDEERIENHFNIESINFSKPTSPLLLTVYRVKRVLRLNKNIDVVIDIGSNNLTNNGSIMYLNEEYSESGYRDNIINSSFLFDFNDIKLFSSIKSISYFIRGVFFSFDFLINEGVKNKCPEKLVFENQQLINDKDLNHINITNDYEIEELNKLISEYDTTRFILILPPETNYYTNLFDQDRIVEKIKYLTSNNNVFLKDFRTSNYELSMFSDIAHLCYDGNIRFTDEFIEYYSSIQE